MALFGTEKNTKMIPVLKDTKFKKDDQVIVDVCAEAVGEEFHFFPHLGFVNEVDKDGIIKDMEISRIPLTEKDMLMSHVTEDGQFLLETVKYDGVELKVIDDKPKEMGNTGLEVHRHHYVKEFGEEGDTGKINISYFFVHAIQKPFRNLRVKK